MSIDERLANSHFSLPAIREVNLSKHATGISLGLGELKDFNVDDKIFKALSNNWLNGATCYTQNAGLPALRKAVAAKQNLQDGFEYNDDNVVITIGVQNAVYTAIKTLSKLGASRVLIPSIHFGIYKKIPAEFNMEVITYPLNDDFSINTEALRALIQPTDIVILNSPSNPTGKVFSDDELNSIASVFKQKLTDGYVVSDEIYGSLVYDGSPFKSFSAYFDRVVVADGVSKSGAIAGLRVGWLITRNQHLAKAFTSNNATIISAPPTANQYAAIPVVKGETLETIQSYNTILKANRDKTIKVLDELKVEYNLPSGSFYIFPKLLKQGCTKAFCLEAAKKENGVVVIPGIAFGAEEYIRISLASNNMDEALNRLKTAVSELITNN